MREFNASDLRAAAELLRAATPEQRRAWSGDWRG